MRGRSVILGAAGAFLCGSAVGIEPDEKVRLELKVADKRMVAGQPFDVEVVAPALACFDGAYRLMLRSDDRWLPTHDLGAADQVDPAYVGPVEGSEADEFSGCEQGHVTHRLRLPDGARPGRYRLKKWFTLGDEEADELLRQGKNGDYCCLDIQWWVDFDVVAR